MAFEPPKRTHFFQQRTFYGGVVAGIVLVPVVITLITVIGAHFRPTVKTPPAVTSGDMTISMDNDLLTAGMRMALVREQSKLPFTISHVTAVSHAGDDIDLSADGPSILGSAPISMQVGLGPRIDSQGNIDFQIKSVHLAGIDVSFFGLTNSVLESALNEQFSNLGKGDLVRGFSYQLLDVHTEEGALIVTTKLNQTQSG
jgi:hypothetical protein